MERLSSVLVVVAAVLFAFAAWRGPVIEPHNHRLVAAGLFCLTLAYLVTHWPG